MADARSGAASSIACRSIARAADPEWLKPTTEIPGNSRRSASPKEPPIKPVPRMATRRKGIVLVIRSCFYRHLERAGAPGQPGFGPAGVGQRGTRSSKKSSSSGTNRPRNDNFVGGQVCELADSRHFRPRPAAVDSGLSHAICSRSSLPTFSIGWFLSRSSSFAYCGRPA